MAREEGSAPHGIRNRVLAVFAVSLFFFVGVLLYGIAQLRATLNECEMNRVYLLRSR